MLLPNRCRPTRFQPGFPAKPVRTRTIALEEKAGVLNLPRPVCLLTRPVRWSKWGKRPIDDPSCDPLFAWRAHGYLLYTNWLNYYVYQDTPYDLSCLERCWRSNRPFVGADACTASPGSR